MPPIPYLVMLNYAVAVGQMFQHAAEQGRMPTDDEVAALEASDVAVALAEARWASKLPKGAK